MNVDGYVYMRVYVCICVCACAYMCMCVHVCVHMCIYVYVWVHVCACECVCVGTWSTCIIITTQLQEVEMTLRPKDSTYLCTAKQPLLFIYYISR